MAKLSYGQVIQQVEGKCQGINDTRLQAIMVDCLNEIFNQVCECPEYQVTGKITTTPGVCDYKAELNDGTKLRAFDQILNPESCKSLTCVDKSARCDDGSQGTPSGYEFWGDTLTIYPTPDTSCPLFIHGYREISCELSTTDADGVVTYNYIDLPEQLHGHYMSCVLALSYAEQGDYEAADYWIRISAAGIDSFVDKKERGPVSSTGVLKSENWCHKPRPCCADGCCEVHGPPVIIQPDETDEDCYGRPVKASYLTKLG